MDPAAMADRISHADGIVRGRALLAAGASRADLRRAVRAGAVLRVRDGVYAVPGTPAPIIAAAAHGGELGCASALRARGVWVLGDDRHLHVWIGSRGRRFPHAGCRCVTHHDDGRSAFGLVGVVRALVQLAGCRGDEAFFAAFESAWRLGLLDRAARAEVRAGLRAGQRWLVDIARPDADSGLESILRLRLIRHGIRLVSQVRVDGVGRVDFMIDGVLILEADGRDGHAREAERHKDLVRDARAAAAGYETLRFDYALIIHDWPTVLQAILARLRDHHRTIGRRAGAGVALHVS
ncbi:type IV toxin-antitoxin system AbiEi family antitoxin domain-containing protein [Microbacterium sp. W1N]|uniref:type IV toxin-antitoxin system AbiEi family antitoxin domain-containing protein n=1 Tax=Microbacterium festucae TaxID=2977531 RepID=UPI0021C1D15C|nr:type IV toxin-antitoxin system AbiEi family antitoxin domain-containing protein [Microbacterium festucae]MCT9821507.1 type IV toxin-antitoxin system AbiEi family antitoxin domain-containing protein [Microbacterium festucae]